jgi:DNA-directed RNA polymerase alpha subunit
VLVDPDKALGEDGWEQPPTLHFMRCGEWKANGGAKGSGDPPTLRLSRPKPPASPKIPDGETSLVDLELSVRAHNLIEMSGIATIEQLARYTAAQIRAIHGFGIASVIEVRAKLAARGLKLSGE